MQPIPVFLPGESAWTKQRGGYSPWGCKESDMTERLSTQDHTCFPDVSCAPVTWFITTTV